jgi:hypothetical protein
VCGESNGSTFLKSARAMASLKRSGPLPGQLRDSKPHLGGPCEAGIHLEASIADYSSGTGRPRDT